MTQVWHICLSQLMLRRYLLSIQHLQSLGNMNNCRPVLLLPLKNFSLGFVSDGVEPDGPQEYQPGYFQLRCHVGSFTLSRRTTRRRIETRDEIMYLIFLKQTKMQPRVYEG